MNQSLIEVVNSKGMVVREQKSNGLNDYGCTHLVTIEGSQYRISFITNVLHGVNYFKIVEVTDLYKDRTYKATRYFMKFIPLVCDINGKTHIALNRDVVQGE